MSFLSISTSMDEVEEALGGLSLNMKRIERYMLTGISREGVKKAKKAYTSTGLRKRSGRLYKSITYWKGRSYGNTVYYVGPKRKGKGEDIGYGYALAKGFAPISKRKTKDGSPKPMQFLASNGKWVSSSHFYVGEHDFVEGPFLRWTRSQDYQNKIDYLIDKQVQNVMKKRRVEDSV